MATGGSPPKPWERQGAGATSSAAIPSSSSPTAVLDGGSAASPALPAKPDSLSALATRNAAPYSNPYNRSTYSSPYGYGGMNSYSSPYSYGGYSSPFGMGGMGGYNRFGGMYGGGMYGAGPQPGMYGPEQSLTQSYQQSTAATFQMIESIVGAFGGFAQMLESTYMATQSSFFAMVQVAEQFGTLKQTLGSVLGIFTLMRWTRAAIAKLTGRPPPASSQELTPANFAAFSGVPLPDDPSARPRPSRKPFIFFIVAVFGLPYLMSKLIRSLAATQEAEQQRQIAANPYGAEGQQQQLDPSKLDFCRVLYDYNPQMQPGQQFQDGIDLAVKKGDLVAVISKTDPADQPSDWWRCRTRDGKLGYLPSPYLETIQRKPAAAQIAATSQHSSPSGSRVNTMTNSVTLASSRANSMKGGDHKADLKEKVPVFNKPEDKDARADMFQRGAFYS